MPVDWAEQWWVAEAMIKYGGGFCERLGRALKLADPDNASRIKRAFPEYWEKYAELAAEKLAEREIKNGE